MKQIEIVEGNLKAIKDTSDFGGPNMWDLYIKTVHGYYEKIQYLPLR